MIFAKEKWTSWLIKNYDIIFFNVLKLQVSSNNLCDVFQRNTFQAVMVTDYRRTYVMYLYEENGMNWKPTNYKYVQL